MLAEYLRGTDMSIQCCSTILLSDIVSTENWTYTHTHAHAHAHAHTPTPLQQSAGC